MTISIAFVGAGPTTLYALSVLLARVGPEARITVFEQQSSPGAGTPYRPGWNDPAMLSNIASIEIPPLQETLLSWLEGRSDSELEGMGMARDALDERAFYPRVVLGQYFRDQFDALVAQAGARGIDMDIRTRCSVTDIRNVDEGLLLTIRPRKGVIDRLLFDHVVLATGHRWPAEQQLRPGYFLSPWPAQALADTPAVEVGIRGSSLTAIDAAVALAGNHGDFIRRGNDLTYKGRPGTEAFRMTMMSRKGLLPEADFYFPLPHAPLAICTPDAIRALIARDPDDLLDAAFDLFRREMMQEDPAFAESTGLADATIEGFSEGYFSKRSSVDPFELASINLEEARRNHAGAVTIAWRDAILRMHEVVGAIVPHLDDAQFERFNRNLKPVFIDSYAAVPHESIERILALHHAGKLEVIALGDDYRIDTHRPEGGVCLHHDERVRHFPIFIEATGQQPMSAIQFPFLSLIEQGVVRDAIVDDPATASRGLAIDDRFRVISDVIPSDRLYCLSLPFIMGRHPFVQGITSSHDMGRIVGMDLAQTLEAKSRAGTGQHTAEAA